MGFSAKVIGVCLLGTVKMTAKPRFICILEFIG